MVKNRVTAALEVSLKKLGIQSTSIPLSHPQDTNHGDFATGIAMKYAKELKTTPLDLAQKIADGIGKSDLIEKIEVVKPGFINIFLSKKILLDEMKSVTTYAEQLKDANANPKTILLEFGQPNTHKTPHIGHLFSYVYGESLSRILEANGNTMIRANYQGDIGHHVARCLWSAQKTIATVLDKSSKEKVAFLQQCYQDGSNAYEASEESKKEIDALNNKIYEKSDEKLNALWKMTREWSLSYYREFEKRLGTKYEENAYYVESVTAPIGLKIVREKTGSVFEESQGAIIFAGEQFGLHTRVFINKFGNPTYEAKDIGLISKKRDDFDYDLSLITTANEQNEYWKVVKKAAELIFPDQIGKIQHLGFGMIQLKTGKMSSRSGNIIDAISLLDIVQEEIKSAFSTTTKESAETISLAAIKYTFLRSEHKQNMEFDINTSISKEGNSGPYMLYTYVRIQSVLKQANSTITLNDVSSGGEAEEELAVLRLLYQFPEVIELAANTYSPHVIAQYLFTLAQSFNLLYQKLQILKAEPKDREFRLALSSAVGTVIKNGLKLLGINTVERM